MHSDVNLVTVIAEDDPVRLALAESLLMDAEIPYAKKSDQLQDLFGGGWSGFNPKVGSVLLQVPQERAEEARAILDDLESGEDVDAASFYDEHPE